MTKFKNKNNRRISKIMIIISLIFFFSFIIVKYYNDTVNDKIIEVTNMKLTKFTQSFLSENIGYDMIKDKNLDDILIVTKNKDGEILYVDYDLKKSYKILEDITNELSVLITNLENGEFKNIDDKNIISTKYGLLIKMPLLINSKYALFANLGPKIYLNINFIGALLTNVKTKITDYGLNNALVELYVTIQITEEVISPVINNKNTFNYDVLIASKIINGRVPPLYGGIIESKSNVLSIPFNE